MSVSFPARFNKDERNDSEIVKWKVSDGEREARAGAI